MMSVLAVKPALILTLVSMNLYVPVKIQFSHPKSVLKENALYLSSHALNKIPIEFHVVTKPEEIPENTGKKSNLLMPEPSKPLCFFDTD